MNVFTDHSDFVYHLALIVSLGALTLLLPRHPDKSGQIAAFYGILFGTGALIGMLNPVESVPGIIFDGRTVLISLCALFFGPRAALIAALIAVAGRYYQGGVGTVTGIVIIAFAAFVGTYFHNRRSTKQTAWSLLQFWSFGMLVHLGMLALMLLLLFWLTPAALYAALQDAILPILILYPLATVLLGKILDVQAQQRRLFEETTVRAAALQDIMDNAPVAMALSDAQGNITYRNDRLRELFGYLDAEIATTDDWMHRAFPDDAHRAEITARSLRNKDYVPPEEYCITRRDGRELFVEISAVNTDENLLVALNDVTTRRQSEIENEDLRCLYALLSQTNRRVTSIESPEALIADICRIAVDYGRFKFAWFGLPQEDGSVLPIARAGDEAGYIDTVEANVREEHPRGQGPTGHALRTGKAIVTNDFLTAAETHPWKESARRSGIAASGVFPVLRQGKVYGALNLYSSERGFFTPDKIATLEEVAADVGFALDGFTRDQDRKQAMAQVNELSGRLSHYLAVSPVVSYALVREDGALRTEWLSENIESLIGYTPEEATQEGWWISHLHEDDRASALENSAAALERGGASQEYRFHRKDGSIVWILDSLKRVDDAQTGVSHIFGAWMDITQRKEAEELKRETDRLFSDLAAQVPGMLFHLKRMPDDNYTFLYASPGISAIFDITPEAALADAMLLFDRIHPDDRAQVSATLLGSASSLTVIRQEFRVQLPGKETRWAACDAKPTETDDGCTLWHGVVFDTTAIKKSDESLRLQGAAINGAASAIVITDVNGHIEWVNPAFSAITKFQAEEALGKNPSQLLKSGLHNAEFYKEMWDTILAGKVWRGTLHNRRKDGSLYTEHQTITPISDAAGVITHFIGIKEDVTERVQIGAELEASRERLQRALKAGNIALWDWSPVSGSIYYSPEWQNHTGDPNFDAAKTLDAWLDRVHPDDLAFMKRALNDHARNADAPPQREFRLRHDEGQYRWILMTASHSTDAASGEVRVFGTNIDNTDRRQLEHEFQQSQKLESIGRLAGGVAHDFNNLLAVINGYSELALQVLPEGDAIRHDLEQIKRAGDRAVGLTRQLLAFSRKQVLSPIVLNVNTVITDAEKMLRRLIGEDIKLELHLDPQLGQVLADPGQVEQILLNLAVNARDAMPTGGSLSVSTSNITGLNNVECDRAADAGEFILLKVTDNGTGMSKEVEKRVFEPFFTTKEQGKGTGLGLATVYGIVTQSGGHVSLKSELGEGTSFSICLPRINDRVVEPTARDVTASTTHGSETILFVEDEVQLRALVTRSLAAAGYNIIAASNGDEALALLDATTEAIDLVVSDVVMPGMSGPVLVQKIRDRFPTLKALYISGYTDDSLSHHGVLDPGIHLLLKPFTTVQLASAIRVVLDANA